MAGRKIALVHEKESYQIIGSAFSVFNAVGGGHKENFYQKALAEEFQVRNIPFKEQLRAKVFYKKKEIGMYILDFLVFDKVVVEIKKTSNFAKQDIDQLYAYLRAMNLQLGLIIHFTRENVRYKRVVNIK